MSDRFGAGETTAYDAAIRLLARREYSRAELVSRLSAKGYASEEICACLDALAEKGLQSDARFAEHFLRSRIARGQGPLKVRAELGQRGVERERIAVTFRELERSGEVDWFDLATSVVVRRFASPGDTLRERARRERFLAGRGFDADQVRHALDHAWEATH